MHRRSTAAVLGAAALALPLTAGPAQAAEVVTVVHAIPDTPVDVYVEDELVVDDLAPGEVAALADVTGRVDVELVPPDAVDSSNPLLTDVIEVPETGVLDLVAFRNELGQPEFAAFAEPVGEEELVVRDLAVGPAVDVLVDDEPVVTGLVAPEEGVAALEPGARALLLAPTGTTDPLIEPVALEIVDGQPVVVYAVGAVEDDLETVVVTAADRQPAASTPSPGATPSPTAELSATPSPTASPTQSASPSGGAQGQESQSGQGDAAVQSSQPTPTAVPAGSGGLADPAGGPSILLVGLGALLLGVGTVALVRR